MKAKLFIFAVSLLIILTACGGKQGKVAGEGKDAAKSKQAAEQSQSEEQGKAQNKTENKSSTNRNRDNGSKSGNSSPKPSPSVSLLPNTLPLKVELTPTCARRGTLMSLRIETRKTASLAIGVSYKDAIGPYWVGYADDQGRFTYNWVIEPDVPLGDGMVVIGAGDHSPGADEYSAYSTGESSREIVPFRVAAKC